MSEPISAKKSEDLATDFRARATYWVAITALIALLPIAILDFAESKTAIGVGSLCIVVFLAMNAWNVHRGRCHQRMTLYGLVPAGMIFMMGVFENDGLIASLWCYPSILACYCMLSAKRACVANIAILAFSLPMVFTNIAPEYAYRVFATLIAISLFSAILVCVIDKQQKRMHDLLIHDPLTGLLNRHTLKSSLTEAIENQSKAIEKSSILAIDIDHFKTINDRHGHDAGDRALSGLAQLLKKNLRSTDKAFRTGGEEFIVLLQDVGERQAGNTARRLRQLTELATLVPGQALTISIGLASCNVTESWTQWMKRADESLYAAKLQGRNRVVQSRQSDHRADAGAVYP